MNNSGKEICCICCEGFTESDKPYLLNGCKHSFHPGCIISWFRSGHSTCPICRADNEVHLCPLMKQERFLIIQSHYKRNKRKSSRELRKDMTKLCTLKDKLVSLKKEMVKFKKEYSGVLKKHKNLDKKIYEIDLDIKNQRDIIGSKRYSCVNVPSAKFISFVSDTEDDDSEEDEDSFQTLIESLDVDQMFTYAEHRLTASSVEI